MLFLFADFLSIFCYRIAFLNRLLNFLGKYIIASVLLILIGHGSMEGTLAGSADPPPVDYSISAPAQVEETAEIIKQNLYEYGPFVFGK